MFVRGGSRAAATSKTECFVIIVNGFQPLTIITKHSTLDVAAALDPSLFVVLIFSNFVNFENRQKSIPDKLSSYGSVIKKLIPAEKTFEIHLQKLIRD